MSDAEALDWLDRLLAEDDAQRGASLRGLADTDPALHARLQRMLASALSPEHSRALAQPVLAGLARLDESAIQGLKGGDVLAGYRLIREIARGGMSVVWLAERADGLVRRHVAFKMPMFTLRDEIDRARFERERDALAGLGHPNVARLYDAGVLPSGQPFIVLEYVDGATLLRHCDGRALDVPARLRLFLQVLAAVEHAHRHLVVHRDLKPANVLVDTDGQVKLLDFGIAKMLAEDLPQTAHTAQTAQAGGPMTPLYAAPEQLRGEPVSTLTDVYSLGVMLHELLTGSLPYSGRKASAVSLVDVLESMARGELPPAASARVDETAAAARGSSVVRLRQQLAGDLATIVGKAVRIRPEDRYGSAWHFAEDLRRYLDNRPIAARQPSLLYRTRLVLARNRFAASVAAAGLVLVAGAAALAWQQHRESVAHERRTAVVRDFMFDLVNDAEAEEGQGAEVTGRQMVSSAVQRARRDFGAQPQLRGELLGELGRMYMRLGAVGDAVPVLREAVHALAVSAPDGDPALNKARAFLAEALLRMNDDLAAAERLAGQARAACAGDGECAKARGYAAHVLSQLASRRGDDQAALAQMRLSAADIERAFGGGSGETAMALLGLAMSARNAGNLVEAGDAVGRAATVADGLRLRAADRVTLERSHAVIDLDLGRYESARDRLLALLAREAPAFEQSLQQRLLATVYVEMGDAARALQAAEAALAGLPRDVEGAVRAYAVQARARAWALAGRADAALADIDAVIVALAASGSEADSYEILRARRYQAEFLMATDAGAALGKLRDLARHHARHPGSPVEHGLVLDALGMAERRAGNGKASQLAHRAAREQLVRQLPADHPHVARNRTLLDGA